MSDCAGIDYSSNAIHIVLVDEETGAPTNWKKIDLACGPGDSFERCRRARDLLPARSRWSDIGVVAVAIEATFSRDFRAATALARVQGALLACLPRDLLIVPLAANHRAPEGWKALTVGKTTASKEEVRDWAINACNRGMPPALEQDFYDAFCLARAMRELLERRVAA